jgi:hypothetical protein
MKDNNEKDFLVLGKDITWLSIEGEALRITHFTPFATMDKGKIKSSSLTMPYAILSVESPKLPQEANIVVVNKVDFKNLWLVFQDRGINSNEEAIVCCVPFFRNILLKRLSNAMPRLHIYIYPKGHLEETNDPNFKPANTRAWFKPIAKYAPKNYE